MPEPLTANQLVAYNLMRIRKTLGLSQAQAAERLEPHLGVRWSKAVYSAAERSYHGNRVRQFTADDLIGLALAFGVPVVYFFMPPKPEDRPGEAVLRAGGADISWRDLFEVMLGGPFRTAVQQRMSELPAEDRPADPRSAVLKALAAMTGVGAERWTLGEAIPDAAELARLKAAEAGAESHRDHGT